MARSIDERVVQMKFENGQFERGVEASIKSVQQLKKGLDFEDSVKGFDKLDKAASDVKMDVLISAVEKLNYRFSLLGETMRRLENQAIQLGKNFVKSLSSDQIAVGWGKFASKTSSVQTIMAATASKFADTGYQMQVVNEQLDKLNWFTDETSYNFVDMVNNIGKFTSNNIDLDKSVTAMQGIANWAAISGANANEASRAMYNISQALATGSVKLIDWKSIENANMATAEFKKTVIETAAAEGTLKKINDTTFKTLDGKVQISTETFNGFNDSLQKGWFNTNVLMTALDRYGGATNKLNEIYEKHGILTSDIVAGIDDYTDGTKTAEEVSKDWGISLEETQKYLEEFSTETMQFGLKAFKAAQEAKTFQDAIDSVKDAVSTGWMKSFELVFGDYMEAKEFWTEIANTLYGIFAESAEARNDLLKEWKELGGRNYFIDTIYAGFAALLSIMTPVKAAWQSIFTPMDANRLLTITQRLRDLVLQLVLTEETQAKLARTLRGLFSVLDIFKTLITGAFSKAMKLFSALTGETNLDILGFTAYIGDALYGIRNWVKEQTFLNDALDYAIDVIANTVRSIKEFISNIYNLPALQPIFMAFEGFVETAFGEIQNLFTNAKNEAIDFANIFKQLPKIGGFDDLISAIITIKDAIVNKVGNVIKTTFPKTIFAFESLIRKIASGFEYLEGPFEFFKNLVINLTRPITDFLGQIEAIDIMLGLTAFSVIAALKQISKAISSIGDVVRVFSGIVEGLQKSFAKRMQAKNIQSYAVAILALSAALFVLSKIDSGRLLQSVLVLGGLAAGIVAFSFAMSKISASDFKPEKFAIIAGSLVALAAAILIIDKSNNILKDLGVLAVIVAGLAGVAIAISKWAPTINKGGQSILLFSVGVLVLISALKKLGKMDVNVLKKGLPGLIAIMGMLAIAMRVMNGGIKIAGNNNVIGGMQGSAAAILAFAASVHLIIMAIKSISKIQPETLMGGLFAIGAIFVEIAVLLRLINGVNGAGIKGAGLTVLAISVAMNIIVPAIKALAKLDAATMTTAMLNLGAIGLVFVAAIAATNKASKYSARAGLMLIEMAAAMAIMPIIIRALSKMSTEELAKGTLVIVAIGLMFAQVVKQSKTVRKSTASLVAMTAMIGILSYAVYQLAKLDTQNAFLAATSMAALLGAMGAAFYLIGKIDAGIKDTGKIIASMVGMTIVIGILSLIALQLAKIEDPVKAIAGAASVSVMMVALAGAMRIINKTEKLNEGVLGNLAIMSVIVAWLGIVVGVMASQEDISSGKAIAMVGAVSVLLLALTGCYAALGVLGKFNFNVDRDMVANFAIFAIIAGALGFVVAKLSKIGDAQSAYKVSQTLSLFVLELVGIFSALSIISKKFDLDRKVATQFLIFSAALIPIGAVVGALAYFTDPVKAIEVAGVLTVLIADITGAMAVLSKMNVKLDPGQAIQFTIFGVIALALGAAVGYLAYLAQKFSIGIPTLLGVTAAIAILVPALGGTVALMARLAGAVNPATVGSIALLSASMMIVFAAITAVVVGLGYLINEFDAIGSALETAPKYCTLLGQAIGGLIGGIAGGIISGIGAGVFELMPLLGDALARFGINAMPFFVMLTALPEDSIKKATMLAGAVAALGGAEFVSAVGMLGSGVLNGIANFFGINTDPTETFRQFGSAVASFAKELDGVNAYKVKAAAEAAGALAEIEKGLPRSGGPLEQFLGKKDIGEFGERLKTFGAALSEFSLSVGEFNPDAVAASENAAEALIKLEKGVPKQGGALQAFFGSSDIAEFGTRLVRFGASIKTYAAKVAGIDTDAIKGSASAGEALAKLENKIPRSGGALQAFFGSSNFQAFGQRLVSFGNSLVDYVDTTKGITEADVAGSAAAIDVLAKLENGLDTTGGIGAFFFGDSSLASFGTNLEKLGKSIVNYSNTITGVDTAKMNQVTWAIERLLSMSGQNINDSENELTTLGDNVAKWIITGIGSGFKSKRQELTSYVKTLVDNLNTAFKIELDVVVGVSKVMAQNGKYIIDGLINGMKNSESLKKLNSTAADLANQVNNSFQDTAGIASPSVVMKENGVWLVKGIAEGITKDTSAEDAMKKKAQNIASAFKSEIDKLAVYQQQSSLLYQLWEVNEGRNATDEQKNEKKLESMVTELEYMAKDVQFYRAALDAAGKEFGTASQQYVEAENTMNEALIKMYKQRNEIESLQAEVMEANKSQDRFANVKAYNEFLKDENNKKTAELMGYTQEEYLAWAREASGFNPFAEQVEKGAVYDLDQIMAAAFSDEKAEIAAYTIESGIKKATSTATKNAGDQAKADGNGIGENIVEGIGEGMDKFFEWIGLDKKAEQESMSIGDAIKKFFGIASPSKLTTEYGQYIIEGLANGMMNGTPMAQNSASMASQSTINAISMYIPRFRELGNQAMLGFANGIQTMGQLAIKRAQSIANSVANIMAAALSIKSPSRVTMEIGKYVSLGLANGITDNADAVDRASEDLANSTISMLDYAKTAIDNVLATDDDFAPQITPVLNMDDLKKQARDIPSILSSQNGISTRFASISASNISNHRAGSGDTSDAKPEEVITNYNFTQNNYSPKALSRRDIYRQTQNQFSQLKGAARR